ncbi:hypothetical protein F5I97DRAFT_1830832 [Phlebopus sp. FC_14]|nr:hypothetical protein F5I97DRAFT_1830832 [Phlebopus sp. FC_14]
MPTISPMDMMLRPLIVPRSSSDGSRDIETPADSDVKAAENHAHSSPASVGELPLLYMVLIYVVLAVFIVAFEFMVGAFLGFLTMTVGHAILRATHDAAYEPPLSSSMKAGAAGGGVLSGFTIFTCIFLYKLHQAFQEMKVVAIGPFVQAVVGTAMVAATSAASCATGVDFMYQRKPQMACLDLTHAARAVSQRVKKGKGELLDSYEATFGFQCTCTLHAGKGYGVYRRSMDAVIWDKSAIVKSSEKKRLSSFELLALPRGNQDYVPNLDELSLLNSMSRQPWRSLRVSTGAIPGNCLDFRGGPTDACSAAVSTARFARSALLAGAQHGRKPGLWIQRLLRRVKGSGQPEPVLVGVRSSHIFFDDESALSISQIVLVGFRRYYTVWSPDHFPPDAEESLVVVLWVAFCFSDLAVEIIIQLVLFSAIALSLGVIAGSINLLVGHTVLRAMGCCGYVRSTNLAVSPSGGARRAHRHRTFHLFDRIGPWWQYTPSEIPSHTALSLFVEIATTVAISALPHALRTTPPPLAIVHAARAGALGASVVPVPLIVVITALFMPETKAMNVLLNNVGASPVLHITSRLQAGITPWES